MLTIAAKLASLVQARANCEASGNTEWYGCHSENAVNLVRETAPSGAGIDSGTRIDLDACKPNCLVFLAEFHHMDKHGGYDGWTAHTIRARPTFNGVDVTVSGPNRNDIKDYLCDVYRTWLETQTTL